jgi:competence protein ComEA
MNDDSKAWLIRLGFAAALSLAGIAGHAADERKPAASAQKPPASAPAATMPAAERMDINSANEAQLATLDGIGEMRAKAIVKGRPYARKDDLVKNKVLSEGVYDKIKDQIIAKQK